MAKRKLTRGQAIAAKCKDCAYDPLAGGTWKQQTEGCNAPTCPLYPYRPRSAAGKVPGENPIGPRKQNGHFAPKQPQNAAKNEVTLFEGGKHTPGETTPEN